MIYKSTQTDGFGQRKRERERKQDFKEWAHVIMRQANFKSADLFGDPREELILNHEFRSSLLVETFSQKRIVFSLRLQLIG